MKGQVLLRRWSMGRATGSKLPLAQRSMVRKETSPENKASPGATYYGLRKNTNIRVSEVIRVFNFYPE